MQSECKAETDDDKSAVVVASVLPAADNAPLSLVTGVESPVRFSPGVVASSDINNIDRTREQGHAVVNAAAVMSDVKPTHVAIDGDRFSNRYSLKVAVDNQTPQVGSIDARSARLTGNEAPAFESSQRVRWFSGVSCASSSTSGGEESPRPGSSTKNCIPNTNNSLSEWFSSNRSSLYHGQTSTPVNGWLDSTSTQSQRVLKEADDVRQLDKSSGSVDGLGSVNSMHSVSVDGISLHKSPINSNAGASLGNASTVERLYHPGIGHIQENRQWLSSSVSPERCWNSRVSVPEPFWALRTALFQPHMAAFQPSNSSDGSQTPPSFNGSFSDVSNNVQVAQNINPSTPVTTTPSKKRVCVNCFPTHF